MNRCFRVVWSNARQAYVVAPEKAGIAQAGMSAGKSAVMSTGMCRTVVRPGPAAGSQAACIVLLLGASTLACPLLADTTLPVGAQITQGSASISQTNNALVVDQATQHLITNWRSFNIGADTSVTFNQPGSNAVALNRVLGQDPSQILGALNANGQVFLVNPNGVVFGQNAQVNTGALVASTLGISDQQFLDGTASGSYRFGGQQTVAAPGDILNNGALNGAVVALMAPVVRNTGTITGDTAIAGGTDVTLDFNGDGLLGLTVNATTLATLVDNQGMIQADGGHVILTARGASQALTGVVNHSGTIQARTLEEQDGRILLLGDMDHGQANVNGLLDASAPEGGDGGFIETSAARVRFGEDFAVTTAAVDGRTGEWLIDPYDFTIADTGGDITGAQLSAALTTNDVTIETVAGTVNCTNVSCGGAQGNGDIFVNADVTWSTNTLTLSAYRNIEINAVMTATGNAGLALEFAQGDGETGDYFVGNFMTGNPGKVNLEATGSFSTKKGADPTIHYTIITDLGVAGSTSGTDLQGINGNHTADDHYVLGADIDASATASWNGGNGFMPIGLDQANVRFLGNFDGLGHTITGLTINRNVNDQNINVGLFVDVSGDAQDSWIRNLGLEAADIRGRFKVGALAAISSTAISNVWSSGTVNGRNEVGGLIGYSWSTTMLSNARSEAAVSGNNDIGGLVGRAFIPQFDNVHANGAVSGNEFVGGLVGFAQNSNGTISNASASGAVNGNTNTGGLMGYSDSVLNHVSATGDVSGGTNTGGLVGRQASVGSGTSQIIDSFATGNVIASGDYVGGLVGGTNAEGSFTNNFATGNVQGRDHVGGLVGYVDNAGSNTFYSLQQSHATGNVQGRNNVGGLVGWYSRVRGNIRESYATGPVNGTGDRVGGLVGWLGGNAGQDNNRVTLENAYARGAVTGINDVGGLVGLQGDADHRVRYSYATGTVTGVTHVGGLMGRLEAGSVSNSFYLDDGNDNGLGTPVTGEQLQNPWTFIDAGWDFAAIWGAHEAKQTNHGYPVLRTLSLPETYEDSYVRINLNSLDRTYGDSNPAVAGQWGFDEVNCTGCVTGVTWGNAITEYTPVGTFDYSAPAVLAVTLAGGTAGNDLTDNIYVSFTDQAITITPRSLAVSGITAANKLFDGTTEATVDVTNAIFANILIGDDLMVTASGVFEDHNVGTDKTVTLSSVYTGSDVGNYSITDQATTTASITPAPQPQAVLAPQAPLPGPVQTAPMEPVSHDELLILAQAPAPAEPPGMTRDAPTSIHGPLLDALTTALPDLAFELDRDTLTIAIHMPNMAFRAGASELQPEQQALFSRLVLALFQALTRQRDQIQALAIRGHASSEWRGAGSADEAYARNLALSQARAKQVHAYILSLLNGSEQHAWLAERLTSEGKAASSPVLDSQGREDAVGSRRVDFRVISGNRQGQ